MNHHALHLDAHIMGENLEKNNNKKKYLKSALTAERSHRIIDKLQTFMQTEKPFLDNNLKLPSLAKKLDLSTNHLSQVINEQFHMNFYDSVNEYRISEAKTILASSETHEVSIVEVALEVGFNSKSTFYAAFKKNTSMTPLQYIKTK